MNTEMDMELKKILWACYEYWESISQSPSDRSICYSWILGTYENKFGSKFHQSKLNRLVKLGFLQKDESSRGGNRRYYKIKEPTEVEKMLKEWNFT